MVTAARAMSSAPTSTKGQPNGSGPEYEDSTFYTQVNMTRTIEQILGMKPMNQYDLVASPMSTLFVNNPPAHTSCHGRTCRRHSAEHGR